MAGSMRRSRADLSRDTGAEGVVADFSTSGKVELSVGGPGEVVSTPPGIDCGGGHGTLGLPRMTFSVTVGKPRTEQVDEPVFVSEMSVHSTLTPVRTVRLAPGKHGFFTFLYRNAEQCGRNITFASLDITPPGSTSRVVLAGGDTTCAGSGAGMPKVTAVRATLGDI